MQGMRAASTRLLQSSYAVGRGLRAADTLVMNAGTSPEDLGPSARTHLDQRRRDRRQIPASCGLCELAKPPYVYLEDGEHYCVDCALLVATTEQSYPAAWRAEDITLEELLREHSLLPPHPSTDRRVLPRLEYHLPEEPTAS